MVVELVGHRLIEHEVWDRIGRCGIEGWGLVEEEASDHASSAVPGTASR